MSDLATVRSSAIDGRVHSPIFRKERLQRLHQALSENTSQIQQAILQDHEYRPIEVRVEFWLAMRCIADAYTGLNPKEEFRREYALSNSRNDASAVQPVGIIIIEPARHSFLYSLVSGIVSAIANGNCVVVQMERTLLTSPKLILSLTQKALGNDIFVVTHKAVTDDALRHRHKRLVQDVPDRARVITIVERNADIQNAANLLVNSRFALRGKSLYAPDVVLVNEWIKKDFLNAVVKQFAVLSTNNTVFSDDVGNKLQRSSRDITQNEELNIVASNSQVAILDIHNRQSQILRQGFSEAYLAIHAVTSMDDAIDLANSFGRLGATYIFSALPTAKYVAQFVDSQMTFVNHIPTNLIYGPLIPSNMAFNPGSTSPYDNTFFTLPSPKYVHDTSENKALSGALLKDTPKMSQILDNEAMSVLPEMKRPSKLVPLGFFQGGMITGAIIVLGCAVGLSTTAYYVFSLVRSKKP
ncbi:hypothetical protein QQS21_004607 [Conoideocrella luteorostrata]|uniref:Aldehyde dehydrogenase domain-containing protein n=1 Tax=Conoideocrella luteorostrata TaxID=1105319 RepID=A0AAJ0CU08_9HYPO|nr:hypothetical protein QQS21_004607 [Conoideocrella luteorostrata]